MKRKYTQSFSDRLNENKNVSTKKENKIDKLINDFDFKKSNIKLGKITESVEKDFSSGDKTFKAFTYLKENKFVSDIYEVDTENKKMKKVQTISPESEAGRASWEVEKAGRELIGESLNENDARNSYNFKESDDKRKRPTEDLKYLDKLLDYVQEELEVVAGISVDLEYQKHNGWSEFYTCKVSINDRNVGEFEFKVNSKGIYVLLMGTWVDTTVVEYDGKELISNAVIAMMGFPIAGDTIKSKLDELKSKHPDLFQEEDYDEEEDDDIEPLFPPMGLN